jgi:hypothetical protein
MRIGGLADRGPAEAGKAQLAEAVQTHRDGELSWPADMRLEDVTTASTDQLIAWLDNNGPGTRQAGDLLKSRRYHRSVITAVESELERRGRQASVARDIEGVAIRDDQGRFDVWEPAITRARAVSLLLSLGC